MQLGQSFKRCTSNSSFFQLNIFLKGSGRFCFNESKKITIKTPENTLYEGGRDGIVSFVSRYEKYIKMWWTGPEIYIYISVLVKKFVIYLYFVTAGFHWVINFHCIIQRSVLRWNIKQPPDSELCISSHLVLHWSSFVSLRLYISDPGIYFLCFIKTWCVALLIYHFYNSLFPAGSRLW